MRQEEDMKTPCKPLNEQVVVIAGASSGTGGNAGWAQACVGTSEKSGRRPVQAIRTGEIHFQTFVMQANGLHVQSDNLLLSGQAF